MLVIIVSMPLTAWADTKKWNCGASETDTPSDSVKATLDTDTGTLTISGTDAMYDWTDAIDVPWYKDIDSINTVIIENGVTTIGDSAFWGCSKLKSVTLPNSVTKIGDSAFYSCSQLTSVTIPNSVTSIGNYAFSYCTGLTEIIVDENNPNYSSKDGILFNKNKTTLICYPAGKSGSYTIPNSVTTIGYYAFDNCSNLTSVEIPNSVTTILDYAFAYCKNLTSVTIPNSVTEIGGSAFYSCSQLTSITIPCNFDKKKFTEKTSCVVPNGDSFSVTNNSNTSVSGTFTYTHDLDYAKKDGMYHTGTCTRTDCCKKGAGDVPYSEDEEHEESVAPTCTTSKICGVCRAEYGSVDPTNHAWGEPTYTWSDDNRTCTAERVCQRDASHEENENATATSETEEATCTEPRKTTYTASFNNTAFATQIKEITEGEPLGHKLDKTAEKAPTCTEPGNSAYWTCERCGEYFSDAAGENEIEEGSWVLPALGHSWGAWEAVDGASHKRTCQRDASHVETGEHAWKETARTDSEVTYTCEVCGATKAEKITPVDPDNPENENSTEEAAQTSANSSWKHGKSLAIQTGDSNVGLYIIFSFVLVSSAAMIFIALNRKRKVK